MKLDKVKEVLGQDTVAEIDAMDETALKNVVVQASEAMREVREELDNNQQYQALKEQAKTMSQGKRDVDKRQKAKIAYALARLSDSA